MISNSNFYHNPSFKMHVSHSNRRAMKPTIVFKYWINERARIKKVIQEKHDIFSVF